MNRLTHGLRSEKTILPGEDPAEFDATLEAWRDHYNPAPEDDIAAMLLAETHLAHWQLRRARLRLEDVEFHLPKQASEWTAEHHQSFEKFTRYKTTAERAFLRWFKELERHFDRLHRAEHARHVALSKLAAVELQAFDKQTRDCLTQHKLGIEQVIEVSVGADGQCETFYIPTNEALLEEAHDRDELPLLVERLILFPDNLVPAPYAWTEACRVPGKEFYGARQRISWTNWLKLADYEQSTNTGHAASAWNIL